MESAKSKIRNWNQYNQSLRNRGSLTIHFTGDIAKTWSPDSNCPKQKGGNFLYTNRAIEIFIIIMQTFNLPLRQTQGFIDSIFHLMQYSIKSPDYTLVSKRRKSLVIEDLPVRKGENMHLLVDSTGFKFYGEGEWKMLKHDSSERRQWRKLHIVVNAETQEIIASELTENSMGDSQALVIMKDQLPEKIASITADGAYDTKDSYKIAIEKKAELIVPPQSNAVLSKDEVFKKRNEKIEIIAKHEDKEEGRRQWKKNSGYHKRSLVETQMFRLKKIFGDKITSKIFESQKVDIAIRCKVLNLFTSLGMPQRENSKIMSI